MKRDKNFRIVSPVLHKEHLSMNASVKIIEYHLSALKKRLKPVGRTTGDNCNTEKSKAKKLNNLLAEYANHTINHTIKDISTDYNELILLTTDSMQKL